MEEWTEEDKKKYQEIEQILEIVRKSIDKSPSVMKEAHYIARKYKQRGIECEICKSKENLHFHHENYAKFEGFTLCSRCHKIFHLMKKKEEEQVKKNLNLSYNN